MGSVLVKWLALGIALTVVFGVLIAVIARMGFGASTELAALLGGFLGACLGIGIAGYVVGVNKRPR